MVDVEADIEFLIPVRIRVRLKVEPVAVVRPSGEAGQLDDDALAIRVALLLWLEQRRHKVERAGVAVPIRVGDIELDYWTAAAAGVSCTVLDAVIATVSADMDGQAKPRRLVSNVPQLLEFSTENGNK